MDNISLSVGGMIAIWEILDVGAAYSYIKNSKSIEDILRYWKESNYNWKAMYGDTSTYMERAGLKTVGLASYFAKKYIKRKRYLAMDMILRE